MPQKRLIYETRRGTKKKRTQRNYNIGFKLGVVSLVEKGDMTYKQAQRTYGIQGRSPVLVWLRKYGNLEFQGLLDDFLNILNIINND